MEPMAQGQHLALEEVPGEPGREQGGGERERILFTMSFARPYTANRIVSSAWMVKWSR